SDVCSSDLGGGSVKCCSGFSSRSVSFWPACSGGSLCLSASSSSSLPSLDSSYTFKKPSNFRTEPVTRKVNDSLGALASTSTLVWSKIAGFICEATNRCQINL